MTLGALDITVLLVYLAGMIAVGVIGGRRGRGARDYVLASKDLPWWLLLLSIVATETSAVTFLSVPGHAYGGDLRFLQLPIGYLVGRLLVVRWLLPLYFRGNVLTAYEVLRDRFGGRVQRLASVLFLVTRTLADGLRLYLTAMVVQAMLRVDATTAVVGTGVLTLLYTYIGGLRGVVFTDVAQFVVYALGAGIAFLVLLGKLPEGIAGGLEAAHAAGKLRVFDASPSLHEPYTLWAGLVGGAFLSLGSHGVDHMIVQRYLAARSQREAGFALSLSGVVVLVQFAFFLLLGTMLWAFYRAQPPATPLAGEAAFCDFILHHLPPGVTGLVLGAVFSAALGSSLNSSAAAFVNDLWLPLRRLPADHPTALRATKLATLAFGALQIAVGAGNAMLGSTRSIIDQVLGIASLVTGILLGLFALGTLTRGVREGHAVIGLGVGLAVDLVLKFGVPGLLDASRLAWPWYGVVGSTTTFAAGVVAAAMGKREPGAKPS